MPKPSDDPSPKAEPRSDPGGSSGIEGSWGPCAATETPLATRDTRSEALGFSADDMLELANRQREIPLRWRALDSGPTFAHSATTLMLEVTAGEQLATEFVCSEPAYPERFRPKPYVELPVTIALRTSDGALDERLPAVLTATARDHAVIEPVTLEPAAVGGSIGRAVAEFYTRGTNEVVFQLSFGPDGTFGSVMGPFSPHKTAPCAYTEYAYWPESSLCWPEREGEPRQDSAVMKPHIARVNRSFELRWSDAQGEATQVSFEVALAAGATCSDNGNDSHPVTVRIQTADGRVDFELPAMLSGGPAEIYPWPAKLRDVEPFALHLLGTVAVDAATLASRLGIVDPSVSAAIVNVWLSSPSRADSPVLAGGLRVIPIDRTGFATPLPTVQLPGGDSEHCFSATGSAAILRGQIVQR